MILREYDSSLKILKTKFCAAGFFKKSINLPRKSTWRWGMDDAATWKQTLAAPPSRHFSLNTKCRMRLKPKIVLAKMEITSTETVKKTQDFQMKNMMTTEMSSDFETNGCEEDLGIGCHALPASLHETFFFFFFNF